MKSHLSKLLFFFITFASTAVFAQKKGDYTILQDKLAKFNSKDSIIYTDEYVNEVSKLFFLTKNDMQRERIQEIPKELEKFYNIHLDASYDLKTLMTIDSEEGLRVRKEPSLKSEKICTLPNNFDVVVTCLGEEVTIDNIKSAWVEILLPQYLWSGPKAEFGWVFGGYLKDEDYQTKNPNDSDSKYYFYEDDLYPPYNSPHLYDMTDGYNAFDRYFLAYNKIIEDSFGWSFSKLSDTEKFEFYEYQRKRALGLLKLIYAGIRPTISPRYTFLSALFKDFWEAVQEKRQIHPASYIDKTAYEAIGYPHWVFKDVTISFDLQKGILTYINPDSKKAFSVSIPSDYQKDFSTKNSEELEFYSYMTENQDIPGPFISMTKKVYENECVYHYEVFFYHIKDGKLIKFLQIITFSEFFDSQSWRFGGYDKAELPYIDTSYISMFYDFHEGGIILKQCSDFPYIQLRMDDLDNYDIIQRGPISE